MATPRGQRARHALPDGSTLELDADSRVRLEFARARRTAHLLQGAAFFAVAHDRARPFSVQAGPVRVTVLGTRFAVEHLPCGGVLVQVDAGRVRVEPAPGQPAHALGAGQSLRVRADGTAQPAAGEAAPWRHGELVFADSTLGDALARLQRYSPDALQASPAAAALPVSGRVRVAQARAWLDTLPHALPVQAQRQPDGGLLFTRRRARERAGSAARRAMVRVAPLVSHYQYAQLAIVVAIDHCVGKADQGKRLTPLARWCSDARELLQQARNPLELV